MLFFRGGKMPPFLYTYLKILYKKKRQIMCVVSNERLIKW